jgi:hypothetical protein
MNWLPKRGRGDPATTKAGVAGFSCGRLAELAICLRRRYLFRSCGRAIFAVTLCEQEGDRRVRGTPDPAAQQAASAKMVNNSAL